MPFVPKKKRLKPSNKKMDKLSMVSVDADELRKLYQALDKATSNFEKAKLEVQRVASRLSLLAAGDDIPF